MVTIEYRRVAAGDRGPWPRQWVDALASTGRFFRTPRGQCVFLIAQPPGLAPEFAPIDRREVLRSILENAENPFLTITGDALTDNDWAGLYFSLADNRWRLPSSQTVPGAAISVRR
jgi:hypothetical protein